MLTLYFMIFAFDLLLITLFFGNHPPLEGILQNHHFPFFKVIVVGPKAQIYFKLFLFIGKVDILFAFRRDIGGDSFYLNPLKVFKVEMIFFSKVSGDHLLIIDL